LSIGKKFVTEVWTKLRPLLPIWPVDTNVSVGDYGTMSKGYFIPVGNVQQDFGISLDVSSKSVDTATRYYSERSVTVVSRLRGEHSDLCDSLNARLEVTFEQPDAIFFEVQAAAIEHVASKQRLGKELLSKAGKWNRRHIVITDLIRAQRTTLLISGSSGVSAIFEADGSVAHFEATAASASILPTLRGSWALSVVSAENHSPLAGVCKVRSKFPSGEQLLTPFGCPDGDNPLPFGHDDAGEDDVDFVQII
jgi:hypothetical protein